MPSVPSDASRGLLFFLARLSIRGHPFFRYPPARGAIFTPRFVPAQSAVRHPTAVWHYLERRPTNNEHMPPCLYSTFFRTCQDVVCCFPNCYKMLCLISVLIFLYLCSYRHTPVFPAPGVGVYLSGDARPTPRLRPAPQGTAQPPGRQVTGMTEHW